MAADLIETLDELEEKIKGEDSLPKDTSRNGKENKITFYPISEDKNEKNSVNYNLTIKEDLKFSMWCKEVKIASSKVAHICKDKINSCSSVVNIL